MLLSLFLGGVGALVLLAGGGLTALTVSNANQVIPNRTEYGPVMWRNEPAAKLFPKTLGTKVDSQSSAADAEHAEWNRLGIAQKTGCAEGLSGSLAAEATKRGCKAVLRATYVDPTGNFVATVAIIVLPGVDDPADGMDNFFQGERDKDTPGHGVKAFAVPETIAADWSDANRSGSHGVQGTNTRLPYAIAATTGSVDGRRAGDLPGTWGEFDAKPDRGPWRAAAHSLARNLNVHLGDLLIEETS